MESYPCNFYLWSKINRIENRIREKFLFDHNLLFNIGRETMSRAIYSTNIYSPRTLWVEDLMKSTTAYHWSNTRRSRCHKFQIRGPVKAFHIKAAKSTIISSLVSSQTFNISWTLQYLYLPISSLKFFTAIFSRRNINLNRIFIYRIKINLIKNKLI